MIHIGPTLGPVVREFALAIFFIWLFIDGVAVSRHITGKSENRERFSLVLIVVGNLVGLFVAIGLAFGTVGSAHSVVLQIVGAVVMGIGIIVRSIAIAHLGRFHTPNVAVRGDHLLLETGLYKHVRHPSYLGALIAFFGLGLALGNWSSVVAILLIMPCVYLYRIREEEAALAAAFGEPYRAYCRRTKRLIPWLY